MVYNGNLGAKLKALRKQRKLSQEDVAKLISIGCAPISDRAVSKWETGSSLPNAEQFLTLCRIYDVRDVLTVFLDMRVPEQTNDHGMASLNKLGKERANEYISLLANSPEFSHKNRAVLVRRQIPLYDLPASAGTGVFLDSDAYTLIDVDENAPEDANLAVRISGDSMMPLFTNGQTVYVRQQPEVKSGEIGIFVLNGEAYCKKLETEGGARLISLNPLYEPIVLSDGDSLKVVGKVIG